MVAQSQTITIENPTGLQRSELVAIDVAALGIEAGKGVIVRDISNIERPTQWTYDGKLLMEVHVRPHGKAVFTVQAGTPAAFRSWVDGRQYPERLDDIAFENDRIGFRIYGPALQRKGEKGYGYDLWVKRTTELVLGELYRNDPRLSFHLGITEHRILSIDKGSNFVESTVWYDGLKQPTDVLAGFPIRPAGAETLVKGDGYIQYADPTIEPDRYQTQVYVALLFPDQMVDIDVVQQHAVGILRRYTSSQRFHYFIDAAWSEFDVRSQAEWQLRIESMMEAKKSPLQVNIVK